MKKLQAPTAVGSKARGADVVVLRATGADGYDAYLDGLAQFNSVQTLKIPAKATSIGASARAQEIWGSQPRGSSAESSRCARRMPVGRTRRSSR